jgi:hypothetical protein
LIESHSSLYHTNYSNTHESHENLSETLTMLDSIAMKIGNCVKDITLAAWVPVFVSCATHVGIFVIHGVLQVREILAKSLKHVQPTCSSSHCDDAEVAGGAKVVLQSLILARVLESQTVMISCVSHIEEITLVRGMLTMAECFREVEFQGLQYE